ARVRGEMTSRRSRAAGTAFGTLLVSWALSACNSPTLPVPPPSPEKLEQPSVVELSPDRRSVRIAGDGASLIGDVVVLMINQETGDAERALVDVFGHYEGSLPVDLNCVRPTNHV